MNILNALFSFNGRLNRKGFWQAVGVHFVFLFLVANLFYAEQFSLIFLAPLFLCAYSLLAVATKRLHDRNRSGKALFILLVPILCHLVSLGAEGNMAWILGLTMPLLICTILILEWGCFAGNPEANVYGERGQSIRFK